MKRALLLTTLLFFAAGYVFLQPGAPPRKLAGYMPAGALLYLEAPNFGGILRDWDGSQVKTNWIASANYQVFSRSNLFIKLSELYNQYGEAAGFLPNFQSVMGIAGTESALALYQIRDVEFLYISRIAESDIVKTQLWTVRDRFERRQAGGVSFYLRTDPASKRTVAFAVTKGYLLLATNEELVAQSLALLAGNASPSVASSPWYRDSVAAASGEGELRLAMNLESLVKSEYFRSYWVQRNASEIRQYWAGVSDVKRTGGNIIESRVFLRSPDRPAPALVNSTAVLNLLALIPPEAGVYKASPVGDQLEAAALIVQKLIGPLPQRPRDWREAPMAVSPDDRAGAEGDLEMRIDEQPLPSDAGAGDSVNAIRALIAKARVEALLLVQSSAPAMATFVQMPSVIVLAASDSWDDDSVRKSLAAAAGNLWTTSQLGSGWTSGTAGRHPVERLNGLGSLTFAIRGRFLFLSDDMGLLTAVMDRSGTTPSGAALTYAAGFRHLRERPNFERVMAALDFTSPESGGFVQFDRSGSAAFFSGNLASLSRVLSDIVEVGVTEEQRGAVTLQTVRYHLGR